MTSHGTHLIAALICAIFGCFAPAQVVINEFSCGTPDWVELRNTSGVPLDLGGWSVVTYQTSSGAPVLEDTYTIPASTIVAAGQFLVLQEYGIADGPGSLPCAISIGFNLNWTSTRSVVVILRDAQQVAADYVYRQGPGGDPGAPNLPAGLTWTGAFTQTGDDCARRHDADLDTAADWATTTGTVCAANPGQTTQEPVTFNVATTGAGDVSVTIATNPVRAGAEFAMLTSTTDTVPNGAGPIFGLAWDALGSLQPAMAGSPFHSWLTAQGTFSFSAPPGTVPAGFHVEAVVVVVVQGQLVVSGVVETTF